MIKGTRMLVRILPAVVARCIAYQHEMNIGTIPLPTTNRLIDSLGMNACCNKDPLSAESPDISVHDLLEFRHRQPREDKISPIRAEMRCTCQNS